MSVNEQVETENNLDTTTVAEQEQVEDTGDEAIDQSQSETVEAAGRPQKKGYQNRIGELTRKVRTLEEQLAETTRPSQDFSNQLPPMNFNEPIVKPGEEIDPQEFEKRVLERAHASTQLQIKQAEAVNRINNEATEMMRVYPELDPESDNFDAELSESVAEATDAYIRSNPYGANVKQFVTKLMKPYKSAATREAGKATENIARQVSQAALRPTSVKVQEKTAGEKSVAELEAELGMVIS